MRIHSSRVSLPPLRHLPPGDPGGEGEGVGDGGHPFVPEAFADPLHHLLGRLPLGAEEHQEELLAPVAHRQVLLADAFLEDPPQAPEHLVPHGVAVGVVHCLEAVYVQHDHAHRGQVAPGEGEELGKLHLEAPAVEKPREGVGVGHGAPLRLPQDLAQAFPQEGEKPRRNGLLRLGP